MIPANKKPIETKPPSIDKVMFFLDEYERVCRQHGMSVHIDGDGMKPGGDVVWTVDTNLSGDDVRAHVDCMRQDIRRKDTKDADGFDVSGPTVAGGANGPSSD